ncbi:type II secretion system protein [Sporanaerobacter acetigenes]|uniref:type II secretion system protein n=1 Tax=Sporanaerobacter acetigenes TaxID=165813 RepID=UPI003328CD85
MFEYFVKKLSKDNRGFTLIELVVVIAILGILSAIAVPKFSKSRLNAAVSAHNANVRTLESAANMYIADGKLTEEVTDTDGTKLGDYIQKWPEVPKELKVKEKLGESATYSVNIKTDGTIIVSPGKADEDGKPVTP